MTDTTMTTFFTVSDRVLSTVENGFDLPITSYIGKPAYGIVSLDGNLPIAIDLNKLISISEFVTPGITYRDLITIYFQNHDTSNLTVDFLPKLDPTTYKYENRFDVFDPRMETGWSIDFGDIDNPTIRSDLYRVGTLDDLILTPPSTRVPENILISVNGVLHKTVIFEGLIYVLDGYATIRQTGSFTLCAIDTTSVGGHTILPITSDMIHAKEDQFQSNVSITLGDMLLDGKSVLFSMDGYLQLFSNFYSIRDRNTLTLKPNRLDYIENFLYHPSMRRVRDVLAVTNIPNPYDPSKPLSPELGPRYRDRNDSLLYSFVDKFTLAASVLDSFEFFKQRLLSPHSFVIVLNNAHLYRTEFPLVARGEERMFECFYDEMPRGTLFYGRGYVLPYTSTYNLNTNQHLIFIDTSDRKSRVYQSGMNNPSYPSARMDYVDHSLRPDARMIEIIGR